MRSHIWSYLVLFVGGGLGATMRHAVNRAGGALLGPQFPAWTMVVNVSGSLAMGLIVGWFSHHGQPDGRVLRLFLTTGILGGYTTFSAFSLDASLLWERHAFVAAAFYVLGSVGLSLVAVFAGLQAVRAATS